MLSGEHMASRELHKVQLQEIRRQFQRFPGDCGSTEVQGEALKVPCCTLAAQPLLRPLCCAVAALTQKIRWMTQHMRTHQKDFHSRRRVLLAASSGQLNLTVLKQLLVMTEGWRGGCPNGAACCSTSGGRSLTRMPRSSRAWGSKTAMPSR